MNAETQTGPSRPRRVRTLRRRDRGAATPKPESLIEDGAPKRSFVCLYNARFAEAAKVVRRAKTRKQ